MGGKVEAVRCDIKYSRGARALVAVLSCTTAVLAVWLPVAVGWRLAAVAWVALHAVLAWRSLGRAARLCIARDGSVRVERRDGTVVEGSIRPGSFAAPWLTVLRWRSARHRRDRTLLLLPGMAGAREMRNIRVILRWG
jgi:toxin CptA